MNKVGIIIEDPRIGGAQKQLIYFLNSLKKKKLADLKLYLFLPKSFHGVKQKHNIKNNLIDLTFLNSQNFLKYILSFFTELKKIINFLEKNDIKTIYVAGGTYCFKSILAGIFLKKKIVWHIHDTKSPYLLKIIAKILFFKVNKILFASEKSRKFYLGKRALNKKVVVINSSVNLNYFNFNKPKNFRYKNLNIGMVANVNPDKDIFTLIKVVKEIELKNKKINFYLYGKIWNSQRNYYSDCKKLVRKFKIKNLSFNQNIKNVKKAYKKLHILICTSRNESLPLVLCEAMGMGLPILTTDVGDIKTFVNTKFRPAGKIFKVGDYEKISDEIVKLYKKKKLIKNF